MIERPQCEGEKVIKCTVSLVRGNVDEELIPLWEYYAQRARTNVDIEDTVRNDPQAMPEATESLPRTEQDAVVALERKECATRVKEYQTLV